MKIFRFLITLFTTILIPIALVFLGIRVLLSESFLFLEYHFPGFPDDNYGFSLDDRLMHSRIALDYLVNDFEIDLLKEQRFPDGELLYNDRELSHMVDVKNVVNPTLKFGYFSWLFLGLISLLSIWKKQEDYFLKGIRNGAWLLIGISLALGMFALVSFWNFFSVFHSIFFEGESWIFYYSDTLIRLFPMRFWQDAFILAGVISIGGSLLILKFVKRKTVS